jgi:nicotinamide phosphoribosyltransferase
MVADSYDVFKFCEMLGDDREIKQKIEDHGKTGGFVVIRPDSGDPVEVNRKLVEILGEKFGYTVNAKGFKVLNNVRLIQGDGINELTVRSILGAFMAMGWSADNIAFGMGGALLQQLDRDTQKFAMKCSSAEVNGEWVDVFKDPVTDSVKASKKGRITLWQSGGEFASGVTAPTGWTDKGIGPWTEALVEVFRDGKLITDYNFEQVRANARK